MLSRLTIALCSFRADINALKISPCLMKEDGKVLEILRLGLW